MAKWEKQDAFKEFVLLFGRVQGSVFEQAVQRVSVFKASMQSEYPVRAFFGEKIRYWRSRQ